QKARQAQAQAGDAPRAGEPGELPALPVPPAPPEPDDPTAKALEGEELQALAEPPPPPLPLPLLLEPQRLISAVVAERYRLTRVLSPARGDAGVYAKIYYLARLLSPTPAAQSAQAAGLISDGQVVVALCGRGAGLEALSETEHERLYAFA